MKQVNLSSRDLEAIVALADTCHFTRAAERCHLSQSAFSQRIARAEQAAGLRLFERSTRHVNLTPEGRIFLEEARRIQQDLQRALAGLQDLALRRVGKVAVAALPSAAAVWMPEVIARYREAHPHVEVELHDRLAGGALDMLRQGRVDLAIAAGGDMREFDLTVLKSERFFVVCRSDHPLADRSAVTLKQLAGHEMIHLASGSSVHQHLQARGVAPQGPGTLVVEHLATVAALVAQGLGCSLVPELTLFHFNRPKLRIVPLRDPNLHRPIALARRKGEALSLAAQAMAEDIACQARGAR